MIYSLYAILEEHKILVLIVLVFPELTSNWMFNHLFKWSMTALFLEAIMDNCGFFRKNSTNKNRLSLK